MATNNRKKFINNKLQTGGRLTPESVRGVSIATPQAEATARSITPGSTVRAGGVLSPEQTQVIQKRTPVQAPVQDVSAIENAAATDSRSTFVSNVAGTQRPPVPTPEPGVATPSGVRVDPATGRVVGGQDRIPADTAPTREDTLRSAFDAFIARSTPTAGETATRDLVTNLTRQKAESVAKAQQLGDTSRFAQGRSGLVAAAADRAINAASGALESLTGQRQTSSELAGARFEFEQMLASDEGNEPIKVGNQLIQKQPDGTFKSVFTGEGEQETQIIQAGGQQMLVDTQTGKTIANLGATEGALGRSADLIKAANEAADQGEKSPFLKELGGVATTTINDLRGRISPLVVGFGSKKLSEISGTPAFDFAQDLETLKADIGFGILQQMREASKTGGALGQVSERELSFLQNTLASINQFQSPENFRKNLEKAQQSINKWTDAVAQAVETGELSAGASGTTVSGLSFTIE